MDDDGFLDDLLNNDITPPRIGWAEQRRRATPAPVSWDMEIDNDDLPAPKERAVPSWARKDDVDKDLDDLFGTSAAEDEEDKRFELEPEVLPADDDVVFVGQSKEQEEQEEEEPELVKKEEPVLVKKEPEDEPEPEPERPSAPPPPESEPEPEPEPPKEEEEEPKQKTKPASLKLKRRGRDRLKVKQPVSNGCTCGGSGTCDECRAGL